MRHRRIPRWIHNFPLIASWRLVIYSSCPSLRWSWVLILDPFKCLCNFCCLRYSQYKAPQQAIPPPTKSTSLFLLRIISELIATPVFRLAKGWKLLPQAWVPPGLLILPTLCPSWQEACALPYSSIPWKFLSQCWSWFTLLRSIFKVLRAAK
jgi:hypothetical protein